MKSIITSILVALCPLLLIILFLSLDIVADFNGKVAISGYGFMVLSLLITMFLLARFNKSKIDNIMNFKIPDIYRDLTDKKACAIVCGYRENPIYFEECLLSLSGDNYDKIIVVIDGNDIDDKYMVDIFRNVYDDGKLIHLNETLYDNYHSIIVNNKYICINQPHRGKRYAMYTGFKVAIDNKMDIVMTVDSDTIIDSNAIDIFRKTFNDKRIGGATGYLDIYNNNTVISYLSKLRYWFAFNLERAFGSYYGGVLCLSGPISCYRCGVLNRILDKWINQKFLGNDCTYGDDRHLTNQILNLGYDTVYNPKAFGYTETPENYSRFIKQQTRWTKSGYRETLWVMKFISKKSKLMSLDISYQIIYPLIIFGLLLYSIWSMNVYTLITYFYGVFIISLIRSIYMFVISHRFDSLLFYNYSLIYLSTIIPIKIYALFTLKDTSWGNVGRIANNAILEWIFIGIWNVILISGIGINIYKNIISTTQIVLMGVICGIYIIGFLLLYILSKYNQTKIFCDMKYKYNIINNNIIDNPEPKIAFESFDEIDNVSMV